MNWGGAATRSVSSDAVATLIVDSAGKQIEADLWSKAAYYLIEEVRLAVDSIGYTGIIAQAREKSDLR